LEVAGQKRGGHMKNQQRLGIILLASFAGFVGGFISNHTFQSSSAFAEKQPLHQKVVIAEEFRLVDKDGTIFGSFGTCGQSGYLSSKNENANPSVPQLRLGQENGFQIILSAAGAQGSRIILKDNNNKVRTVIGNMELYIPLTRITHNRQASSIVLFDKFGRFLWSAPGGIKTDLSR
jgi:hypothetical protein